MSTLDNSENSEPFLHPSKPEVWKINVQGVTVESDKPTILARHAIKLAGFDPDTGWIIILKITGEPRQEISLDTKIDLTHPGIEKLRLTPHQINNGEAAAQRLDFRLLPQDEAHLGRLGLRWVTICEGARRWLLLHAYPLPRGYNVASAIIAIDIPVSYPGAQLDMFYCNPPLMRTDGARPPQTEHSELILGLNHQRWSRHRQWDSARDTLATHLTLVDELLAPGDRGVITRNATLVVSAPIQARLHHHLFPGDGLEAAALLLCRLAGQRRVKLLSFDLIEVPHDACRREVDRLTWPGAFVEAAISRAETENLVAIAVHSHPRGALLFSSLDDESDTYLLPAIFEGTGRMCGSAIMVDSGQMRARLYPGGKKTMAVDLVLQPGEDISLSWHDGMALPMAFTSGMTSWLGRLSACVIGVSGTGSIVAEQLARLGFGEVILIDFDRIEPKNLNRILNSTLEDAKAETFKVEAFGAAIRQYRAGCKVVEVPCNIATRAAILAATDADVLFSCVDTGEGRHIADRIGAYFLMPLFDVGVSIPTFPSRDRESRSIIEVCGRIDYVFPGSSNLQDRGVYTAAMLEAEYLAQAAPDTYRRKLNDGYLQGAGEQAPAVISLNMRAASTCVTEFIARSFPFRHDNNAKFARSIFTLCGGEEDFYPQDRFALRHVFALGAGAQEPLIGLPAFMRGVDE